MAALRSLVASGEVRRDGERGRGVRYRLDPGWTPAGWSPLSWLAARFDPARVESWSAGPAVEYDELPSSADGLIELWRADEGGELKKAG
jgi:hypothetical protein